MRAWQVRAWLLRLALAVVLVGASCEGGTNDGMAQGPEEDMQGDMVEDKAMVVASEQLEGLARANLEFGVALYQQLRGDGENIFLSPYSVSTALEMTYAGAAGPTEREMAEVLRLGYKGETLHSTAAALERRLLAAGELPKQENEPQTEQDKPERAVELYVANRLWGQQGYPFKETFVEVLRRYYGSDLVQVDFREAAAAAERINGWVAQQTRGMIKDLISAGMFTELTRLVLTNAVYFKGRWEQPFNEKRTEAMMFRTASGEEVEVQAMRQVGGFRYFKAPEAALLELDYAGSGLSMVVVLPEDSAQAPGLGRFEEELTAERLSEWMGKLGHETVEIYLPRFKMETKYQLNGPLADMGMKTAFDSEAADFSGMTSREDLFIEVVVHQACVKVDEEGTVAAAATGVVMAVRAMPSKPVVFRADRPFLVLIREKQTGLVLFMGRVGNPLG